MPRDHRAAQPNRPHPQPEDVPETAAPDAPACPGKCNAAWRAAEKRVTLHGGTHDLEPWPGQPVWCPPCATEIRGALDDWPDLARRLREEIGAGVKTRLGEHVSGSKNRPIHEHERPSLLLDEMAEWLSEWAATIARNRGLPERVGHKPGKDAHVQIASACPFLLTHLDWHLAQRPAEEHEISRDFGVLLLDRTHEARTITGTQEPEPVRVIGVPCPCCDYKALEREIEDSATRKAAVAKYVYGGDGDVRVGRREVADDEARYFRVRVPDAYTVPTRETEIVSAPMAGASTGYIKCRHCKPIFRMAPVEYHRWTRMLAAGEHVRARATAEKLREIFGSSVPAQYRVKK